MPPAVSPVRPADPDDALGRARFDLSFRSASFLRARSQVERFARARNAAVLIEGDSGTGKTQIARYLHACSRRASGPFHCVDLAALDDSLASSELFGHVAGAFTDARSTRAGLFVSAKGGTLFLDEIGKASLAVQQKLLRAVEYGEVRPVGADRDVRVDVRIVAASNVPLELLVLQGRFLSDLHSRLASFRVRMPTLRERRPDIPLLVEHYIRTRAAECGHDVPPRVAADLLASLVAADWPNNLRQLDGTVCRLLVEAEGEPELRLAHCRDDLEYLRGRGRPGAGELRDDEVADAMRRSVNNVSAAARDLGVHRATLYRRLQRGETLELRELS